MDNNSDIIELIDILYGMVTEAWSVPLGNDKCVIEREKAVDIINEIKANLPTALAEAKRIVAARDEFIGNAKREAEAMRKSAEEKSRALIEEQEIMRIAKAQSAEMINAAETKSNELRRVASEYVDKIMSDTEASVNEALAKLQNVHGAFRSASSTFAQKPKTAPVSQPQAKPAEQKPVQPQTVPTFTAAPAQKRQGTPIGKIQR